MKKFSLFIMAALLMLGMAQCQKEKNQDNNNDNNNEGERVSITLKITDGSKAIINPGVSGEVTFTDGDQIVVTYDGKYVGLLDYVDGEFVNDNLSITATATPQPLYFYFLGNRQGTIQANATSCTVSIADQSQSYAVLSYGPSNETYNGSGRYTAFLLNQCGLVKFNFATAIPTYIPVTISKTISGGGVTPDQDLFPNGVTVDFGSRTFTTVTGQEGSGIKLKAESQTERWAILPIMDAMDRVTVTAGNGELYEPALFDMPAITANAYLNTDEKAINLPALYSIGEEPTTWVSGNFTVGNNTVVKFSPGNLQCTTVNGQFVWSFAENQYDCLGTWSARHTVDLFNWGATGYNNVSPFSNTDYIEGTEDLIVDRQTDWGYCANRAMLGGCLGWRTLSSSEWHYLFNSRTNADNLWGHGSVDTQVNGTLTRVNGIIICPDRFDPRMLNALGLRFTAGLGTWGEVNVYTDTDWEKFEDLGCVFLPAAGVRAANGYAVSNLGQTGYYWSSSVSGSVASCYVYMRSGQLETKVYDPAVVGYQEPLNRNNGYSVRLVRDL